VTELLIMRHGKSDWEGGVADHERPLAPRGVRAAQSMGRFLAAAGMRRIS
jgi:phosphohistidine phosphatase